MFIIYRTGSGKCECKRSKSLVRSYFKSKQASSAGARESGSYLDWILHRSDSVQTSFAHSAVRLVDFLLELVNVSEGQVATEMLRTTTRLTVAHGRTVWSQEELFFAHLRLPRLWGRCCFSPDDLPPPGPSSAPDSDSSPQSWSHETAGECWRWGGCRGSLDRQRHAGRNGWPWTVTFRPDRNVIIIELLLLGFCNYLSVFWRWTRGQSETCPPVAQLLVWMEASFPSCTASTSWHNHKITFDFLQTPSTQPMLHRLFECELQLKSVVL